MRGLGPRDEAPVALTGLGVNRLGHAAFEASAPVRVALYAEGSVVAPGDTARAAYAWIVRRADGAVVWQMRPAAPARGTFASLRDTIELRPGVYDAYVAAFSDPLAPAPPPRGVARVLGLGRPLWHGDAGRWGFRVSAADPSQRGALRAERSRPEDAAPGEDVVWQALALGPGSNAEETLRVTAPVTLTLDALGAAGVPGLLDSMTVVRLAPAETLWAFPQGARPAGGAPRNVRAQRTLTLGPGLYRVALRTADSHGFGAWAANPPPVPSAWGVRVRLARAEDRARVTPARLATDLPRLVSWDCVGSDEALEARLVVSSPLVVRVSATAEISGGRAHDGATLDRERADGSSVRVWETTRQTTERAGGASKNRRAETVLTLSPAAYTLRYRTDGSHACGDFNDDPPDEASFWGVRLAALSAPFDPAAVRVEEVRPPRPRASPEAEDEEGQEGEPDAGRTLVALQRLGNDVHAQDRFTLGAPAEVAVVALGELLPGEALDWGWIEDAEGTRVWEMARQNTRAAGGSAKNRLFEGTLDLPAGTYTVHFVTNGRHAYGAFEGGAPRGPERWGIRVALPAETP